MASQDKSMYPGNSTPSATDSEQCTEERMTSTTMGVLKTRKTSSLVEEKDEKSVIKRTFPAHPVDEDQGFMMTEKSDQKPEEQSKDQPIFGGRSAAADSSSLPGIFGATSDVVSSARNMTRFNPPFPEASVQIPPEKSLRYKTATKPDSSSSAQVYTTPPSEKSVCGGNVAYSPCARCDPPFPQIQFEDTGARPKVCTGARPKVCTGARPKVCTGARPKVCTGARPKVSTDATQVESEIIDRLRQLRVSPRSMYSEDAQLPFGENTREFTKHEPETKSGSLNETFFTKFWEDALKINQDRKVGEKTLSSKKSVLSSTQPESEIIDRLSQLRVSPRSTYSEDAQLPFGENTREFTKHVPETKSGSLYETSFTKFLEDALKKNQEQKVGEKTLSSKKSVLSSRFSVPPPLSRKGEMKTEIRVQERATISSATKTKTFVSTANKTKTFVPTANKTKTFVPTANKTKTFVSTANKTKTFVSTANKTKVSASTAKKSDTVKRSFQTASDMQKRSMVLEHLSGSKISEIEIPPSRRPFVGKLRRNRMTPLKTSPKETPMTSTPISSSPGTFPMVIDPKWAEYCFDASSKNLDPNLEPIDLALNFSYEASFLGDVPTFRKLTPTESETIGDSKRDEKTRVKTPENPLHLSDSSEEEDTENQDGSSGSN